MLDNVTGIRYDGLEKTQRSVTILQISLLLRYQVGYILLGLAYNVVSLIIKASGGKALASTDATVGIAAMLVFSLFLIPGFLKHYTSYRILMGIAFFVFGYSGVVVHVLNYARPELYYAPAAWILAIVINLFGVVLNAIAASGMFLMHGGDPLPAVSGRQNRHHMSGKSTFLRNVGINLVLAYIGAPVCAEHFRCSLMRLWTSMRLSDNLFVLCRTAPDQTDCGSGTNGAPSLLPSR